MGNSIGCRKIEHKVSRRPITTKENIKRNQQELKVRTSNLPRARENADDQVAIGFSFESDWLRKWREFSRQIIKRSEAKPEQSRGYYRHPIENCL